MSEYRDLTDALSKSLEGLALLQEAHESAVFKVSAAQREATEMLNKLNDAQKEVDMLMLSLRKKSGGDWSRADPVEVLKGGA
ncbi:hypothetical protein [Celeribacter halophilus]|uniref:Uncharacterized protein n=1 Tax=Celeribacter halophilus TaxID=576117 RepID=A0A1I3XAD5_9RHOB|nr:hypothetical protein [Celeribacter halophilus]PZX03771.1 hypothetical protein LX82_03748 [Celeribacter halophilus]SFK16578.1 hypothetical protein SAMN04488138_1465 [Celeribacter halophilus]